MPLNKLENFLKNVEGRILYVSPADLDSTDSILNQGNSQTKPFKTLQRALIEAARFSYNVGRNNDTTEKTTILLMPGEHEVDNRPGHTIRDNGGVFQLKKSDGTTVGNETLSLKLETNFDINQEDNVLYKFNSVNGGVIVPRGTSIVGLDLRKTKIRPKYIPNPTDDTVPYSAVFRVTGACYFWQFSIFDGDELGKVYTDHKVFNNPINQVQPTFSHHKLTCFEYADGVNDVQDTGLTDLDMYYYKLSRAYNTASNRNIAEKFMVDGSGTGLDGFAKQRPEWEIVGAFADDPIKITKVQSGSLPGVPTNQITVTTQGAHNLSVGTPIKIKGVGTSNYNISTKVASTDPVLDNKFTYVLPDFPQELPTLPEVDGALITIETDTVSGASPYIFNISLRSVWGMNGMCADGSKASGFRSMVVAQFTGVSLQKDDRAFVKYNPSARTYEGISISPVKGTELALQSSSTNAATVYHLDSDAIYRKDWQTTHVKITNDAILQIVSVFAIGYANHFMAESGGDASITNSNSNFGQLALVADGFRKDAFRKDDNAFITHVITPEAINSKEEDIEWVQISAKTRENNNLDADGNIANPPLPELPSNRLYLFGYSENASDTNDKPHSPDIKPPFLTQGFRIGARVGEKLYAKIDGFPGSGPDGASVADILMSPSVSSTPVTSARRTILVNSVDGSTGTFRTSNAQGITIPHGFATGEKIIIISDDGDLPEKILEHKVYFAITQGENNGLDNSQLRLALSFSDAVNDVAIKNTYFLDAASRKLKITTRVTDKEAGDVGHPIQYDTTEGWYITTNENSQIRTKILEQQTAANANLNDDIKPLQKTDISFFFRITDTRSLDDKIFKTRVSIPKEVQNGKNIQNGFVLQESSSTNVRTPNDLTFSGTLTASDFAYKRNQRFISDCTFTAGIGGNPGTIKVETERPHNLQDGDLVKIDGIRSSGNADGASGRGYNIEAKVDVIDNMTFKYNAPVTLSTQPTTNFRIDKTGGVGLASSLPRFTRKDLQSNLYFYRNDVVTEYDEGVETGVYHGYQLFADLEVPTEFDENKYGQTVVDLYPQLDRDNHNDTPRAAKSFALRSPLGKVATNDLLNSITRESIDKLLVKFGSVINVKSFTDSGTSGVITLERDHNIGGIAHGVRLSGSSGLNNGTYENVKIFNGSVAGSNWSGALGKVTISGGQMISHEITNPGSGFSPLGTEFGHWDNTVIGGSDGTAKLGSASGVALKNDNLTSSHENLVIQVTGSGIREDAYFRTTSIPGSDRIGIAKTTGDPSINSDQYVFVVGNTSGASAVDSNGTVTVTTLNPHGLEKGNKFQLNDSNNNNLGTFTVSNKTGSTTFTFDRGNYDGISTNSGSPTICYVLKHGLSANDGFSGKGGENLSVRGVPLYGLEDGILTGGLTTPESTTLSFNLFGIQKGVGVRFPQGSYIQIDDEILRIASFTNNLSGGSSGTTTVIRGVFGTRASAHVVGSLVRKLSPIPLELHRYSILRASGHTFEYLGYGPGNYSTALPQVQVRTLTEREEFLSQAQERAAGSVVYTGMNDKGDFFIGNSKKSALTGEETTFDNPVPTVAGEDPSKLSVVFDEVTIKERLVVEGGRNNNILSQFDGPVNFNQNVRFGTDARVTIKNETSLEDGGALTVDGGVQIDENLGVGGTSFFDESIHVGVAYTDGEQLDAIIMGQRKHIVFDNKSGLGPDNDGFRIFVNEPQTAVIKNETRQRDANGNVLLDEEGAILGRDINIMTRKNSKINFGTNGKANTASFVADGSAILKYAGSVGTGTKLKTIGVGATITGQLHFNPDLSTDPIEDTAIINNAILLPQGRRVAMGNEFKFQIFENSVGDGRIKHQGENNMSITVRNNKNILISANDGSSPAASFNIGAGTTLFYNGAKRLETTSTGGNLGGNWRLPSKNSIIEADRFKGRADSASRVKIHGVGEYGNSSGPDENQPTKLQLCLTHADNDPGVNRIFTRNNLEYDISSSPGELKVPGDIIAFVSDDRLKTNKIELIDALNKVNSINGFTYNFNETAGKLGFDTEIDYVGVSAQEVQKVLPEAVKPAQIDNDYITVQYEKLVPLLIEAIKELSDKVDDLEQKLSDK